MPYREATLIPPPIPPQPSLMERFRVYREKVRKNVAFWWRFNKEAVYGGIVVCAFLVVFLAGCYEVASDAITFGPCCSTDDHHHYFHRSLLRRSSFSRRNRRR